MITWASLVKETSEWERKGYVYVPLEQILGKKITVLEYEIFKSETYGLGVRVLLDDGEEPKKFIVTYATVLVRVFNEHPEEVKALIDNKQQMSIIQSTTAGGRKFFTFKEE